jgi:hypothetical protein
MAAAPLTVQCMPARLSLWPMTDLQPASTRPVPSLTVGAALVVADPEPDLPCRWSRRSPMLTLQL